MVSVEGFLTIKDMILEIVMQHYLWFMKSNQFSNVGRIVFEWLFWLKDKLLC